MVKSTSRNTPQQANRNRKIADLVTAPRIYILTGFMGAGKSSVGLVLSRILGFPFVELDEHVEAREGRTIARIFQESGESGFRQIEHLVLRTLLSEAVAKSQILALGGGAFVQPENVELIEQASCFTIFLDAPAEELFQRCAEQNAYRPLRQNLNDFRNLYEARRARYLAARLRIETSGKSVETVAAEVACSLGFGTEFQREQS